MTLWEFPDIECAWCHLFPCVCKPAREEPCVCGGPSIRAQGEWEWAAVIREHNRTPAHVAWRQRDAATPCAMMRHATGRPASGRESSAPTRCTEDSP